jgi:hypothetical protein
VSDPVSSTPKDAAPQVPGDREAPGNLPIASSPAVAALERSGDGDVAQMKDEIDLLRRVRDDLLGVIDRFNKERSTPSSTAFTDEQIDRAADAWLNAKDAWQGYGNPPLEHLLRIALKAALTEPEERHD